MRKDTPEAPPISGLVAAKYELCGLIGRGGMGSVWEGRHVSLGTRVAIKFIESEYSDSAEARHRFDNEARAAATLQSKHAIQIFDHGVSPEGKPYIVMELLTGEPLDKRVERLGRLPLHEVTRMIQQVCRALARAHEKGIVHRDLKPENIFLVRTPDEDEEIAKVLDFGIAKFAQPTGLGISSGTKTGAILGTPFYMSPEQARGLRSIDHRSDLWSLGVIAYKCLTGQLPFDGESVGDLLVKICTAPLPVPSQVAGGLPPQFDGWFARALERDPERRFGTAAELSDALARVAGMAVRRSLDPGRPHMPTPAPPGSWQPGSSQATPGSAPARSGVGETIGAAATQAQFSATGRRSSASQSRGVFLASVAAAIVGLGGGVLAVVKLAGSPAPPADPRAVPVDLVGGAPSAAPVPDASTAAPAPSAAPSAKASRPPVAAGVAPLPKPGGEDRWKPHPKASATPLVPTLPVVPKLKPLVDPGY